MPSLQSAIVRGLCRVAIKRRLAQQERSPAEALATIRSAFQMSDRANVHFTRGLRIVPVETQDVRGEWILPAPPRDRALLYIHGGGYVACSALTYRRFTTALARESNVPVFAVDYRLAPEHRFPAALDDVVAAYDALRRRIPAPGIVIAGDSAGGGLALATALALRERDPSEAAPAGIVAFSPWTDLLGTGSSIVVNARADDMLVGAKMTTTALYYVADHERRAPLASPLYGDHTGFPDTLIFASTTEVLRDDAVRFADRARGSGARVELVLEESMPHVWPIFFDVMPEARRTVATTVAFLDRVFATAPVNRSLREGSVF